MFLLPLIIEPFFNRFLTVLLPYFDRSFTVERKWYGAYFNRSTEENGNVFFVFYCRCKNCSNAPSPTGTQQQSSDELVEIYRRGGSAA